MTNVLLVFSDFMAASHFLKIPWKHLSENDMQIVTTIWEVGFTYVKSLIKLALFKDIVVNVHGAKLPCKMTWE